MQTCGERLTGGRTDAFHPPLNDCIEGCLIIHG